MTHESGVPVVSTCRQPVAEPERRTGLSLKRMLKIAAGGLVLVSINLPRFRGADACTWAPPVKGEFGPSSWPQQHYPQTIRALQEPPYLRNVPKLQFATEFGYSTHFKPIVDHPCGGPAFWTLSTVRPCEKVFAGMENDANGLTSPQLASVARHAVTTAKDALRDASNAVEQTQRPLAQSLDIEVGVRLALARCDMAQLATFGRQLALHSSRLQGTAEAMQLRRLIPADAMFVANSGHVGMKESCASLAREAAAQSHPVVSWVNTESLVAYPGDTASIVCQRFKWREVETGFERDMREEAHSADAFSAVLESLVGAMERARYHTQPPRPWACHMISPQAAWDHTTPEEFDIDEPFETTCELVQRGSVTL